MPGSKPGERRGGRVKGVPNKVTADVKAAAQHYTTAALKTLAEIMGGVEQPAAARVSAAVALLDRAHGKPMQAVQASGPDGGPIPIDAGAIGDLSIKDRAALREAMKAALGR